MIRSWSVGDRAEPLGRQSPSAKTPSATAPPTTVATLEERLQMERLPAHRTGLRINLLERQADLLTIGTEGVRIDADAGHPVVGDHVIAVGHHLLCPRSSRTRHGSVRRWPFVARCDGRALSSWPRPSAARRLLQPVVVANLEVLVVGDGSASLRGEVASPGTSCDEFDTSIPPPLVVMILLPLNEKVAHMPNPPAGRPR